MQIAVVASPVTPLRPAQAGGAQSMVSDLAVGLARRGHHVRLHCAAGSIVPGVELVTVPTPLDAAAALVMPGGAPPPPAPGVSAAIDAMFEAIAAADVDVVSQHAFDAAAFRQTHALPILHTLHLPPLVPAVLEAVRGVPDSSLATVSESCSRSWRAHGVRVARVLPNGVVHLELERVPTDRSALIAGRISPEKGIDHAVAAARVAGLAAWIAGARYDPAFRIDLNGARELGELTRAELRRVMARSAVTVCAARWDEPFGLVAAEAQMAGCPVAAYARGGLPEVIEEGVSGFLSAPDDVTGLAKAITKCLALDRASVASSARRRLGLEAALDRYERALHEVAA